MQIGRYAVFFFGTSVDEIGLVLEIDGELHRYFPVGGLYYVVLSVVAWRRLRTHG